MIPFVHLRTHSCYSIQDGLADTEQYVKAAVENNQPGVAVTDLHRMFNSVNFYEEAQKAGLKGILGVDAWVEPDVTQSGLSPEQKIPTRMLFIAKNTAGYKAIMGLVSKSYMENRIKNMSVLFKGKVDEKLEDIPLIKQSWLTDIDTSNIFALSGEQKYGEIANHMLREDMEDKQKHDLALSTVDFYSSVFKNNFFLEVQRAGFDKEFEFVKAMVQISKYKQIPLVATHPVQFIKRSDFFAHHVRTCISEGTFVEDLNNVPKFTREQYFKSTEEMNELFQDIPDALENVYPLYQMCNLEIELGKSYLPNFVHESGLPIDEAFVKDSVEGLEERLDFLFPDLEERERQRPVYAERLKTELDVVIGMGFPSYYMIMADIIKYAKNNDVLVGPGRGSGAGSLVAYALKITDIDPIPYNLLFERFLNPERVSMPDFDVDFESNRRHLVLEYAVERYGEEAVSQISALGYMKAKAVVRDVGRTLQYNILQINDLCKMIIDNPADPKTLMEHIELEPKLKEKYENEPSVKRLFDVAMQVEGLPKNVGKHAAGVLISPTKITDFTPLYLADGGTAVSQYDKNQVETAGLVKFDFLATKILTVIQNTERLITESTGEVFKIESIPLDDSMVYRSLADGNAIGVFQFESAGMRKLLKKSKPDQFEDIIALVALFRPGPLQSGMVDNFIDRKHGKEEISYPDKEWQHESLKEILEPTYGIILYQEQVMQIAQVLAGYSLGSADILRRAMGKKKPEEMAKQRSVFRDGAAAKGIDPELAMKIFDLVEKFAGYGFNKSHSAAYALQAYQTAYLKTHYPAQFYAASMNAAGTDNNNTDRLEILINDGKMNGVQLLAPDINESEAIFKPKGKKAVYFGLAGIKGISINSVNAITEERDRNGPFESFENFFDRVDRKNVNKRVIEALIKAGAFDSLNPNRASLYTSASDFLDYSSKMAKAKTKEEDKLEELWDAMPGKKKPKTKKKKDIPRPFLTVVDPWSIKEQLEHEKAAIGYYFSNHPFDYYKKQLGGLEAALPLSRVDSVETNERGYASQNYLIAGIIQNSKQHIARSGKKMQFLDLNDGNTIRSIAVFDEDLINEKQSIFQVDRFIAVHARISRDNRDNAEFINSIAAEEFFTFEEIQSRLASTVHLAIEKEKMPLLTQKINENPGVLKVRVYHPESEDSERYIVTELKTGVAESQDSLRELKRIAGSEDKFALSYEKNIVFERKMNMSKKPRR